MSDDKTLDRIIDKVDKIQEDLYSIKLDMAQHRAIFEEHLKSDEQMAESIGFIEGHLSRIDSLLSAYNDQLIIHIAGVHELKEANRIERDKLEAYRANVDRTLEELKKPQIVVKGLLWVVGSALSIGALYRLFLG